MNALALTIDGERGHLFETTHSSDAVVFVPEAVFPNTRYKGDGFDQSAYMTSGWAAKNARFNSSESSKHAFPALNRPVGNADEPRVELFLQRLRHAYTVELFADAVN
jgi:hypothetical protein